MESISNSESSYRGLRSYCLKTIKFFLPLVNIPIPYEYPPSPTNIPLSLHK